MERLNTRYSAVLNALERFNEDINILEQRNEISIKYHRQFRNSAIQSFEFTIDTLWKFIKDYLDVAYNVTFEVPTPRGVFRECLKIKFITRQEAKELNQIIIDRNLTSHTYNENLAEEIKERLYNHYKLMKNIIARIDTSKLH